eukprot:750414-Alexandrium_andersonii.AAC.1
MRAPHANKVACVRGKILPAGLYGAAATPMPVTEMARLSAAIIKALRPGAAASRSRELAQWLEGRAVIDPYVHVLISRIVAFRRQWFKSDEMRGILCWLIENPYEGPPQGPVGLLRASVGRFKLRLDGDLVLSGTDELPLGIAQAPWQQLKTRVAEIAIRA